MAHVTFGDEQRAERTDNNKVDDELQQYIRVAKQAAALVSVVVDDDNKVWCADYGIGRRANLDRDAILSRCSKGIWREYSTEGSVGRSQAVEDIYGSDGSWARTFCAFDGRL
jgi:hypothetical protein